MADGETRELLDAAGYTCGKPRIDKLPFYGYNAITGNKNGRASMKKIKEMLARKTAYAFGAGSLFDFAGVLDDKPHAARRPRKTFLPQSVQDDWHKVGEDLRAAMHELTRQSRGA